MEIYPELKWAMLLIPAEFIHLIVSCSSTASKEINPDLVASSSRFSGKDRKITRECKDL